MKHNELQKFSNFFVNQEIKRNKTFESFLCFFYTIIWDLNSIFAFEITEFVTYSDSTY